MEKVELAPNVILMFKDASGTGTTFASTLQPKSPNITKIEIPVQLSLESYGLTDVSASGQIINFVDAQNHPQVSVVLFESYKVPTVSCACYEILKFIVSKTQKHSSPRIMIISFSCIQQTIDTMRNSQKSTEGTLYAVELNGSDQFSKDIVEGLEMLPSKTHISDDMLASILHCIRIMKVPAVLLLSPLFQHSDTKAKMIVRIGDLLSTYTNLLFSKELLENASLETRENVEDDWRRLYG